MFNRLLIIALAGLSSWAFGGIGAGNGFRHVVRADFDFHIAYPLGWDFTESEVATEPGCGGDVLCAKWLISNAALFTDPAERSWVEATFFLNAPVDSLTSLEEWASSLHPETDAWQRDESGPFASISSGAIADGANAWQSTDYYLTRSRQVVKVVWRAHVNWRNSVDHIINSIDRAASEPEILKIESESQEVRPGQEACLRIEVNDLRDSFEQQGLKISFLGQPKHYSLKRITWVPERNWYRVCVDVTSAFDQKGLYPSALTLAASDGRSRNCVFDGQRYECEECVEISPRFFQCSMTPAVFSVAIAEVNNASVDRQGPEFSALQFDVDTKILSIVASDPSGISIGEIYSDRGEKLLILPESGSVHDPSLNVSQLFSPGWNTIKAIVLYDKNGVGGMLRDEGEHTYRYYDSEGNSRATDFVVINYFSLEAK